MRKAIGRSKGLTHFTQLLEGLRYSNPTDVNSPRGRRRFPNGHEQMVEYMVSHFTALLNPSRLVESPVDAEIDTALAILLFSL